MSELDVNCPPSDMIRDKALCMTFSQNENVEFFKDTSDGEEENNISGCYYDYDFEIKVLYNKNMHKSSQNGNENNIA